MLIDRIGRFRGIPTQGVIGKTKNGFPQFVVTLLATEYFDDSVDEATGDPVNEWVDWTEYDHSITAYLVLFNASKALLNYEQVMKAFDWDGTDLEALQQVDFGELQISFDVEENNYEGNISLRVNWIDAYDSEPGSRGLKPMESSDIKALAAQYKGLMKTAPKAAPVKAATPAKTAAKKRGRPKGSKVKSKEVAPSIPSRTASPVAAGVPMPEEEAWTKLSTIASEANLKTEPIADAWLEAVDSVAADVSLPQDDFTDNEWGNVFAIASGTLEIAV